LDFRVRALRTSGFIQPENDLLPDGWAICVYRSNLRVLVPEKPNFRDKQRMLGN
jgi:hypothetical protein